MTVEWGTGVALEKPPASPKAKPANEFWALELVERTLLAGEGVTICFGKESDLQWWSHEIICRISNALNVRDDVVFRRATKEHYVELSNGGFVQMGRLQMSGASVLHTPVLIIVDMLSGDPKAYSEARCVLTKFKDGSRPVYVEV